MKYAVIAEAASEFSVSQMCQIFKVSESGYYAWLKRPPSRRRQERMYLKTQIRAVWEQYRRVYGAPRIHDELRDRGICVGRHRVARLMQEMGIAGKSHRKRRPRTTQVDTTHPVAPNVLDRQFDDVACGTVWLSDITYIDTDEGDLYLAGLMDLGSREIVGMAMADHMRTELVDNALQMAVRQHRPQPGTLHHSDRGSQYTSADYQQALATAGMHVSMSRTGSCLDNAPMESFWATLKRECADQSFPSHDHARVAIFDYVMGFYNRERKHSALGYLSPVQYARLQL